MTFVLTARWVAKEGEEEAVREALAQLAGPTREESGCLLWQPHRDPDDPRVFFIYEQYTDRAAYDAHGESEHFERWGKGAAFPHLEDRRREFYETTDLS
jgi:quinol monooxygenase YgiN